MIALKMLRMARNLTQGELSKQLGVSQASFCLWEKGKVRPRVDLICRLAATLGVEPPALDGKITIKIEDETVE